MPLHKYSYSALLISAGLFFSYCNSAKYILANDTLYTGAKIQIDSSKLSHREKKKLKTNLLSITRPKTNSKILGLRIKLWIYNLAGKPKKKKSIRSWVKDKFGEPPVLASSLDLERNSKILQSYLQNKGYFQALVDGDTTTSHKKT